MMPFTLLTTSINLSPTHFLLTTLSGLLGTSISILIRLEVGSDQLYNILVTACTFLMIFFIVVPLIIGILNSQLLPYCVTKGNSLNYNYYYLYFLITPLTLIRAIITLLLTIWYIYCLYLAISNLSPLISNFIIWCGDKPNISWSGDGREFASWFNPLDGGPPPGSSPSIEIFYGRVVNNNPFDDTPIENWPPNKAPASHVAIPLISPLSQVIEGFMRVPISNAAAFTNPYDPLIFGEDVLPICTFPIDGVPNSGFQLQYMPTHELDLSLLASWITRGVAPIPISVEEDNTYYILYTYNHIYFYTCISSSIFTASESAFHVYPTSIMEHPEIVQSWAFPSTGHSRSGHFLGTSVNINPSFRWEN